MHVARSEPRAGMQSKHDGLFCGSVTVALPVFGGSTAEGGEGGEREAL